MILRTILQGYKDILLPLGYDSIVTAQLQLWLFCCWGCGCCWAVTKASKKAAAVHTSYCMHLDE